MPRLALIYPPYSPVENQPNIKAVADNYGIFPPLSLAQAAAVAISEGWETTIIDANAKSLTKEQVLEELRRFEPDILGFTITTYLFHQTMDWISYLKEETGLPVLVGGAHMGLYPTETLMQQSIDFGLIGEAELTLPAFLRNYKDRSALKKTKGAVFRDSGKIIVNRHNELFSDLDSAPFPARSLLPNDKYYSFISKKRNFTGLITSRGCPYTCIFCEQRSQRFRKRSAQSIMEEVMECYSAHGIREIDFFDSTFTLDKKRIMELCRLLKNSRKDLIWSARSRVDCVDNDMLATMRDAGCTRIYYGIESGDENILKNIRKATTLKRIRETIRITKKNGIDAFGYFMVGSPGETAETINRTIRFAKTLDLDYVQFSKVSSLPGTDLYAMWMETYGKDYWKEYLMDRNKNRAMERCDCTLSEEEIESMVKKAYKEYYFRPQYVVRKLFRLASIEELRKSVKAAKDMLLG